MRRVTLFALIVLCVSGATSWQGQPQWRVVQHLVLTGQTAPIPQTEVFTPSKKGLYRLSAYLSAGGTPQSNWEVFFTWNDIDGHQFTNGIASSTGPSDLGMVFAPEPQVPFTYSVTPIQASGGYDLAFTIEEFQ